MRHALFAIVGQAGFVRERHEYGEEVDRGQEVEGIAQARSIYYLGRAHR